MDIHRKMNVKLDKRIATFLLSTMVLSFLSGYSSPFSDDYRLQINPAYKLRRMSNGEVIIYTNNQDNAEKSYSFNDFYADLLLAAHKKQRFGFVIETISRKYNLSEDECRRELKHAVYVLAEWNIIILDNDLASR